MRRVLAGLSAAGFIAVTLATVGTPAATATPSRQAAAAPTAATVPSATPATKALGLNALGSQRRCDAVANKKRLRGVVPTPFSVLGYRLGKRAATNDEIGRYWAAADKASPRVRTGIYGTSVEGRPLRYALVGKPSNLAMLPTIRRDLATLRDPATPDRQAKAIMRRTPPILWVAANVHGDEPSGADAVVRLLWELADRSDCVANAILDNAIVGLVPVQNPDGRQHETRNNANAFDMNRDGLVSTQPEIAARIRLLWKFPPQLFIDEHENSSSAYFFPPTADPVYHETPNGLFQEVQDIYGPANARAFRSRNWKFETWRSGYDFFAQVYGDTVPTTQLGAVGMTFEQGYFKPYPLKVSRHYTSAITSLYAGATHRAHVLRTWRDTFVKAKTEGADCELEPNRIFNPGHELTTRVPSRPVCGYFLLGNSRATRTVVSHLQDAHVIVKRLTKPAVVPDYRPYGDAPRSATLPAGTYWVTLDQAQKHWVQATLNEDTYVPFPYFYDVSGWSLPLLAGIDGGSTGTPVTAPVSVVSRVHPPAWPEPSGGAPRVAVLDQFKFTRFDYQNTGWLKWRLSHDWGLPYQVLRPEDVTPAALSKVDVLVVGNVDAKPVYQHLRASGRAALVDWVDHGGRYVGWQEGSLLASSLGISQVGMNVPDAVSPGSLMRVLTPGGTTMIEWDSDYNLVLDPGTARVVTSFPAEMFVSGFATDSDTLAGTALETVEDVGAGSVTVFGFEPNFRAIADGSAALLRTAILRTPSGSVPFTSRVAPSKQRASNALDLSRPHAFRVAHELGRSRR
ncbi:MAG: hypothetical protein KDB63_04565 [Nocardioidaceae bacterium]|nr:hypothetical protein [Nocardioidaceae bacterium]